MKETVDELVEAVMDIAREQSHDDAALIIADRIRKHVRAGSEELIGALVATTRCLDETLLVVARALSQCTANATAMESPSLKAIGEAREVLRKATDNR